LRRHEVTRWYVLMLTRLAGAAAPRAAGPDVEPATRPDAERGDVPGWVLITVMTAGMVTALWVLAEPQLKSFLQSALNAVHGP